MIDINRIYNTDCMGPDGMARIDDGTIDLILCDLPYGVTQNKWDDVIPMGPMWAEYKRIIKPHGVIALTSMQPFTSQLVMSNPNQFKYEIIWDKAIPTGFLNAKKQVLRRHENILIFYSGQGTYNPQKTPGKPYDNGYILVTTSNYGRLRPILNRNKTGDRYPTTILKISNTNRKGRIHPNQKPVKLFEWLIKTYSNPGELVLDNCTGSGTTAVACINTSRNFIGFETDKEYYKKSLERIEGLKKAGRQVKIC